MAVKTRKTTKTAKPAKNETSKELTLREAPIERKFSIEDVIGSVMAREQLEVLTAETPNHAIKFRKGPQGKKLRYVSHGYVTDRLNKAFGFDWDFKLLPVFDGGSIYHMEKVQTGVNQKTNEAIFFYYIAVYGELTVRIHNPKKLVEIVATVTKPGPGSAVWYSENEWGDALKAAKSDGLKVAAHELGIALDLYWDDAAEQDAYQQKQEEERRQKQVQNEQEFITSLAQDVPNKSNNPVPANGVMLIAMAQSIYGLELSDIKKILGDDFINNYTPGMWDKIVKLQEDG